MQTNDVNFAGYAGRDAEERTTGTGTRVVNFSLCQTEKRDGGDISTWVTVVVFGTWCDLAAQVKKGDNVVVQGKLSLREWETKEGTKRTSVELVARSLGILQRIDTGARSGAPSSGSSSRSSQGRSRFDANKQHNHERESW